MLRNISFAVLLSVGTLCSTCHAGYIGNSLPSGTSTDGDPPLVILGEYNATAPTAASTINFPSAGYVTNFVVDANMANQHFVGYIVQPAGTDVNGNQEFTFIDSTPTLTPSGTGIQTFSVGAPWSVAPGDLIAFWGSGPTYSDGSHADADYQSSGGAMYFANQPVLGSTYTFGVTSNTGVDYQYLPNGESPRIYSIGVIFTPEPTSLILLGLGAVGLLVFARRQRAA